MSKSDAFSYSDGQLPSPWAVLGTSYYLPQVASGVVRYSEEYSANVAMRTDDWDADHSSQVQITNYGNGGGGVCVRASSLNNGQAYILSVGADGSWSVRWCYNGLNEAAFMSGSSTPTDGDTWKLAVVGTTFIVYQNDAQQGSTGTDSTCASGVPGIAPASNNHFDIPTIDNWVGTGEVASGPSIAPRLPLLGVGSMMLMEKLRARKNKIALAEYLKKAKIL